MTTKNAGKLITILIAMSPGQYGAMRIAQWSASVASCKATRCRHQASAHAILPRLPPWLTISNETQNTNKTQLLPSFLMVDNATKLNNFGTQNGTSTHVIDATNCIEM
jgi:hypothetical protein